MPEKAKRKVNPRRRLLIRLIFGICMLVALIAGGIYLLRPTGAQVVFIAPDDEGVDQIWIADLNNPENPRQLTDAEEGIGRLQTTEVNDDVFFRMSDGIWQLNATMGQEKMLFSCSCSQFTVHPGGQWIAYQETGETPGEYLIYIYDIQTTETTLVDTVNQAHSSIQWIADRPILAYSGADVHQYTLYSLEANTISNQFVEPLLSSYSNFTEHDLRVMFAPDSSRLAIHDARCQQTIEIQEFDAINQRLFTLHIHTDEFQTELPFRLCFHDWHPDNEHILISESWTVWDGSESLIRTSLSLYNIITGTQEILSDAEGGYEQVQFNVDGSRILYITNNYQLMIYDLDSRESISYPLSGYYPQWVNGGR